MQELLCGNGGAEATKAWSSNLKEYQSKRTERKIFVEDAGCVAARALAKRGIRSYIEYQHNHSNVLIPSSREQVFFSYIFFALYNSFNFLLNSPDPPQFPKKYV